LKPHIEDLKVFKQHINESKSNIFANFDVLQHAQKAAQEIEIVNNNSNKSESVNPNNPKLTSVKSWSCEFFSAKSFISHVAFFLKHHLLLPLRRPGFTYGIYNSIFEWDRNILTSLAYNSTLDSEHNNRNTSIEHDAISIEGILQHLLRASVCCLAQTRQEYSNAYAIRDVPAYIRYSYELESIGLFASSMNVVSRTNVTKLLKHLFAQTAQEGNVTKASPKGKCVKVDGKKVVQLSGSYRLSLIEKALDQILQVKMEHDPRTGNINAINQSTSR
jgi:hypothetical protein